MNDYIIRPYQKGDEDKIIALFSVVFQQTIDINYWRWKFCRLETVYSLVVESKDNKNIVGHVGAIPFSGIYHSKTIPCFQMCDVMIHPDVRGFLGSKNLFTQLFKEISEFIVNKHPDAFCYGFPGRRPFILGQRAKTYSRVEQPVISEFPATYHRFRWLQLRQL
ncbi:MAG: GNAT family N-acetyltransferase, partial [Pseudomonadota bacterium]